jgi:Zn-dependent oligopeptidase
LKQDHTGDPNAEIYPWDKSFYNNLLKEEKYNVDEEKIKEYFPTNHVVNKCMEIYEELL